MDDLNISHEGVVAAICLTETLKQLGFSIEDDELYGERYKNCLRHIATAEFGRD